jgi:23S rRNA (uracil1939-C5)-methyltransferase
MGKTELAVGDSIEINIERLAYGGEGVAHYQGLAIFVREAAPGDWLRIQITERKKRFARAVIEEIITPSPSRREPPCKYFGQCGGCQLQHISYQTQLTAKVAFIRDALKRTGKIDWPGEIKIHSANEFHYRLRAKFKIEPISPANQNPAAARIGFYHMGSHKVCDIENCPILLPELNDALRTIRAEIKRTTVKEIEIAASQIFDYETDNLKALNLTIPDSQRFVPVVSYAGAITREIGGATYRFAPSTFFQANALLLDEFVKEAVGVEKGDLALDLYAGVGLFTIPLARNFKQVIGVESNPRSVEFAESNLFNNKVENANVVYSHTDRWLKNFLSQTEKQTPDLILLDPPRNGAAEAIEWIGQLNSPRIHYVSCDPMTMARDLNLLVAGNYEIERLVAFDMFPQTYHVESIAFLKKR